MRSIYKKPRLRPNENFIRHIFTYLEKTLPWLQRRKQSRV
jgi:hypothetical protein